jgi:hypothetical protein
MNAVQLDFGDLVWRPVAVREPLDVLNFTLQPLVFSGPRQLAALDVFRDLVLLNGLVSEPSRTLA